MEPLPDCMMPDGADPCAGYHRMQIEVARLQGIIQAQRAERYDQAERAARYYARATALRAVYGVMPEPDEEAEDAYWRTATRETQKHCRLMVAHIMASLFRYFDEPNARLQGAPVEPARDGEEQGL